MRSIKLQKDVGQMTDDRKWIKHFDGNLDNEEECEPQDQSTEKVKYIEIEIEEGNENVELIFQHLKHHLSLYRNQMQFV